MAEVRDVYPTTPPPAPVKTAVPLTEAETAELNSLYEQLKPEATAEARKYVLARTPAKYQVDMTALIDADWPLPEPPVLMDAQQAAQQAEADANNRRY